MGNILRESLPDCDYRFITRKMGDFLIKITGPSLLDSKEALLNINIKKITTQFCETMQKDKYYAENYKHLASLCEDLESGVEEWFKNRILEKTSRQKNWNSFDYKGILLSDPLTMRFPTGQYKDCTMEDVLRVNRSYVVWASENFPFENVRQCAEDALDVFRQEG